MLLYDAYYLGTSIEYIKHLKDFDDVIVKSRKKKDAPVLDVLRGIANDLEENEMNPLIQMDFDHWITKLRREYKSGENIKEADAKELTIEAHKFDDMIADDLLGRNIIELEEAAVLNTQALLETSEGKRSSIFETKTWKKLPSIAKSDFSDAAKCLLVKASTPATMVGLRGFEAVMREYYCFRTKNECGKKNLGDILRELRKLPDANEKLLGYIDYLRSERRNLAQHPDKQFSQKEAEGIFSEIINAVKAICSYME